MNKIQEFFNEQFGTVRSVTVDGVVFFYGIDIAKALGYSNASKAVTTHCKRVITKVLETSNSQNGKTVKGKVLARCIWKMNFVGSLIRKIREKYMVVDL